MASAAHTGPVWPLHSTDWINWKHHILFIFLIHLCYPICCQIMMEITSESMAIIMERNQTFLQGACTCFTSCLKRWQGVRNSMSNMCCGCFTFPSCWASQRMSRLSDPPETRWPSGAVTITVTRFWWFGAHNTVTTTVNINLVAYGNVFGI